MAGANINHTSPMAIYYTSANSSQSVCIVTLSSISWVDQASSVTLLPKGTSWAGSRMTIYTAWPRHSAGWSQSIVFLSIVFLSIHSHQIPPSALPFDGQEGQMPESATPGLPWGASPYHNRCRGQGQLLQELIAHSKAYWVFTSPGTLCSSSTANPVHIWATVGSANTSQVLINETATAYNKAIGDQHRVSIDKS